MVESKTSKASGALTDGIAQGAVVDPVTAILPLEVANMANQGRIGEVCPADLAAARQHFSRVHADARKVGDQEAANAIAKLLPKLGVDVPAEPEPEPEAKP